MTPKKVFVSGCYDLLHSGHVEFFRQAAQYGDLYVGIGSDETILHYKKHRTVYPERERLFMVKAIRYVKDAFINAGDGVMDFVPTVEQLRPDIFVVNEDGASDEKEALCRRMGMEYIVLPRTPSEGLTARSSTDLKKQTCSIPTRLDLAGTWIDQPYVSPAFGRINCLTWIRRCLHVWCSALKMTRSGRMELFPGHRMP